MNTIRTIFTAVALCGLATTPAAADLAADMYLGKNGQAMEMQGKFYFDEEGRKMRYDPSNTPSMHVLFDMNSGKFLMVMSSMSMPSSDPVGMPRDPGKPCAEAGGGKKVGMEQVDGRDAEKWQCNKSSAKDAPAVVWFDPELKFPIGRQHADGTTVHYKNIKTEPLDDSLFAAK
jgi:hypothetical protein